jgi:hypothetical protein
MEQEAKEHISKEELCARSQRGESIQDAIIQGADLIAITSTSQK